MWVLVQFSHNGYSSSPSSLVWLGLFGNGEDDGVVAVMALGEAWVSHDLCLLQVPWSKTGADCLFWHSMFILSHGRYKNGKLYIACFRCGSHQTMMLKLFLLHASSGCVPTTTMTCGPAGRLPCILSLFLSFLI